MQQIRRHKVFVSYHHENDQEHRDRFEKLFADVYNIMDSRSVRVGEIPRGIKVEEIDRRIREGHLRDSTVTVVLVGADTWRRKFVDWEIAATIRDTPANPRSGLIGIFLPSHPSFGRDDYDEYIIPPRLHFNVECGFAELYDWSESPRQVASWVDLAFSRRKTTRPDNSSIRFAKNWRGPRWYPPKRVISQ